MMILTIELDEQTLERVKAIAGEESDERLLETALQALMVQGSQTRAVRRMIARKYPLDDLPTDVPTIDPGPDVSTGIGG